MFDFSWVPFLGIQGPFHCLQQSSYKSVSEEGFQDLYVVRIACGKLEELMANLPVSEGALTSAPP